MDVLTRMAKQGHHPEEECLERYVMKLGSEREIEEIEVHLLVCEQCRGRLHEAEEWVSLMKSAVPLGPSRLKVSAWRMAFARLVARPMVTAAYAAIAIVLCTGAILLRDPFSDAFSKEERVELHAMRGGDSSIQQASSHNWLILKLDTTGLSGSMEVQIVDSAGTPVWSHAMEPSSPEVKLDRKLAAGLYWVRINSRESDHRTLRESILTVH